MHIYHSQSIPSMYVFLWPHALCDPCMAPSHLCSHLSSQSATLRSSTGPGPQPLLSSAMSPASRQPRHWSMVCPARPVIGQGASEHRRLEPFSAGTHCEDESDQLPGPGRMRGQESSSGGQLAVWDHTLPGPLHTQPVIQGSSNEWSQENQESSSETFDKVISVL